MSRVLLIRMPFGAVHIPSLGLTQLKTVLARELGTDARAEIHYLTHDCAASFGLNLYRYLSDDSRTTVTGLADWLFRDLAFPGAEDSSQMYIARYMPALGCRCEVELCRERDGCASSSNSDPNQASSVPCCLGPNLLNHLITKRAHLGDFMDELIDRFDLANAVLAGFTSMFDQTVALIAMARRLKARNQRLTTIIGDVTCELGIEARRDVSAILTLRF